MNTDRANDFKEILPRFRGKVGKVVVPEEIKGKWFFRIELGNSDGTCWDKIGDYGPFDTKKEAEKSLKHAIKMGCDVYVGLLIPGEKCEGYYDMNDNEKFKRWADDA